MSETRLRSASHAEGSFRHEALLYGGEAGFVAQLGSFLRDAVVALEPTLVVVSARKIGLLREELGADADGICFADMSLVGENPARIIPAWRDFVDEHAGNGRSFRGVGEPIWAARTPAELIECQRHEALLNLAFAESGSWWLVCPYDAESLDPAVIDEALRTHPHVLDRGVPSESPTYHGLDAIRAPFAEPLPEPGAVVEELRFEDGPLDTLRDFVARQAVRAGLGPARTGELVLAVYELATNSIRHGGGAGRLRCWQEEDALICEIRDRGRIDHPLVGRERPAMDKPGGRGLWIANQLCDLVQVRSFLTGSAVRVHMRRG